MATLTWLANYERLAKQVNWKLYTAFKIVSHGYTYLVSNLMLASQASDLVLRCGMWLISDVERLFSTAGDILTDERNRLKPETAEKLLFCRENLPVVDFKYWKFPKKCLIWICWFAPIGMQVKVMPFEITEI